MGALLALGLLAGSCSFRGSGVERLDPPTPPPEASEPLLAERLAEATRAVRDQPTSAAAWGRLGEVYDVNSFATPALACYAHAQELDPDEWRWSYFAGLLLRPTDPVAALKQLSRAAELHPDYAALQLHLGTGHYLAENFEQAEQHYRRALALDPGCVNAQLGLARVAVARGDPVAALSLLQPAGESAGSEGAVHLLLAQVYHELGRHPEAEREERLTAASPIPALPDGTTAVADPVRAEVKAQESVRASRQLEEARHYLLEGRDHEAEEAVEKALVADPDSVAALVVSARLLAKRGEIERARERLERAVALDDRNATAHVELGTAYALAGMIEPAISVLERALQIDPTQTSVKGRLAGLLVQAGRDVEALDWLRSANRDLPDDAAIRDKLALVLVRLDRFEEAEPILRELLSADPRGVAVRARLGQCLWRLRRYDEALRIFEPLDALAAAQAETGDFAGAVRSTRAALEIVERAVESGVDPAGPGDRGRLEPLLRALRARLALYERRTPYRDGG